MKKLLACLLLLLGLALLLGADDLDFLRNVNSTLAFGDFIVTRIAISNLGYEELNPLMRLYVKKPLIHLGVYVGGEMLIRYITMRDTRWSKVFLGIIYVCRGYILYRNLKEVMK